MDPNQDEDGNKVRLMERVHMGIGGEVRPLRMIAECGSKANETTRDDAVLYSRWYSPTSVMKLPPRKKRLELLAEGLGAKECRLNHELRDVWSLNVTVARDDLAAEQIPRSDRERVLKILTAVEEGQPVHVSNGLSNQRIRRIFVKRHVAQHSAPVVLNRFSRRSVARYARRWRDVRRV